jgi:glycosyltransferase involved in cell wall biosynthesis
MRDMRIAFFLPNLEGGGAERVCVNLGVNFLQRGMDVDIVLVRATGPLLEDLPVGIQIHDLKAPRILASLPALVKYLRNHQPQALIAAPDTTNVIAGLAVWLAGEKTKILATNHINLVELWRNSQKLQEKIYPWLLHLLFPIYEGIVTVSDGNAQALLGMGRLPKEKVHVIYNPIMRPEIGELAEEPLDHPWFAPGEPAVILAAGRLVAQKDFPTLLWAFSLLRQRHSVRLMILGDGSQRETLVDMAEILHIGDDFSMPGFDPNPFRYMSRCAVFASASTWEGFGNVLVEALACGAQVVATDCPSGPAEILDHGRYGRLVPVSDPAALADSLEAALIHPYGKEMLKERAMHFTVEAAAEAYLRVLGLGR